MFPQFSKFLAWNLLQAVSAGIERDAIGDYTIHNINPRKTNLLTKPIKDILIASLNSGSFISFLFI